jgi:lipopolysaccharide biosynthesis glycosyltransferase
LDDAVTSRSGAQAALVFACDENQARGLAVAMSSALQHLSGDVSPVVYVLDAGIAAGSRERLVNVAFAEGVEVAWIYVPPARLSQVDATVPQGPMAGTAHHVTRAGYARLLIPELLPRHVQRAVYLDSDVLVRGDLSPLFDLDLDGALFAAVTDFAVASAPHPLFGESIPHYFNSGVLVLDVGRWRNAAFAERVLGWAGAQQQVLPFLDQDALNAVAEDWYELEPRWNVQQGFLWRPALATEFASQREALYDGAVVLHFTGGTKPWHVDSATPGTFLWLRALIGSGWYSPREGLHWLARWLVRHFAAVTAPRFLSLPGRVYRRVRQAPE